MLELECLNVGACSFTDHVQLALQRVLHNHVVATTDKYLAQDGLFLTHSRAHGHVSVHWHISPAEQDLAFCPDRAFHFLFASQARSMFFWQKDHANAVFAGRRQGNALFAHFFAVQGIRQLNQDTSAVAHQLVSTYCAAVIQILKNLQALLDDGMALLALDVGHKAHATCVVLVARVVKTRLLQMIFFSSRCHGASFNSDGGNRGCDDSALQHECQSF